MPGVRTPRRNRTPLPSVLETAAPPWNWRLASQQPMSRAAGLPRPGTRGTLDPLPSLSARDTVTGAQRRWCGPSVGASSRPQTIEADVGLASDRRWLRRAPDARGRSLCCPGQPVGKEPPWSQTRGSTTRPSAPSSRRPCHRPVRDRATEGAAATRPPLLPGAAVRIASPIRLRRA